MRTLFEPSPKNYANAVLTSAVGSCDWAHWMMRTLFEPSPKNYANAVLTSAVGSYNRLQ